MQSSVAPTRCTVCQRHLPPKMTFCPICKSDNEAWVRWLSAPLGAHLRQVLGGSVWGWLVLLTPLGCLMVAALFGATVNSLAGAILAVSLYLSGLGASWLYRQRHALYLSELQRRVAPAWRWGWLHWAGLGMLASLLLGLSLAGRWSLGLLTGGVRPSAGEWLALGLLGCLFSVSAMAYAIFAYTRWLSQRFPPPLFWNLDHLQTVAETRFVYWLAQKTNSSELAQLRVLETYRASDGGLRFTAQVDVPSARVGAGVFLKQRQLWRIHADSRGQIQQAEPLRAATYLPDGSRPYPAPPAPLQGEVVFPATR